MSPPDGTPSFEDYVRERRRALLRLAVVVTDDPELAQDVVQDVLLRAQQRWDRIAQLDAPHAYVRRMVVNEVLSWRRKWARIEPRPDAGADRTEPDPTDAVDRRDELLRRLARLPAKQRAAVALRFLDDLPDDEIAAALDCSPATVRVHIHRALAKLRVELATAPVAPVAHC